MSATGSDHEMPDSNLNQSRITRSSNETATGNKRRKSAVAVVIEASKTNNNGNGNSNDNSNNINAVNNPPEHKKISRRKGNNPNNAAEVKQNTTDEEIVNVNDCKFPNQAPSNKYYDDAFLTNNNNNNNNNNNYDDVIMKNDNKNNRIKRTNNNNVSNNNKMAEEAQERENAGYIWHTTAILDKVHEAARAAESNGDDPVDPVMLQAEIWLNQARSGVRAVVKDDVITDVNVAGRPRAKHGGSQGQHTTAASAVREVVISATAGRSPEKAKLDLADLFSVLLTYPAFAKSDNQPTPPNDLVTMLQHLANPNSELSQGSSIDQLATLYLEIRDALPGASLNSGINGTAKGAGRGNTTIKREPGALRDMRNYETTALSGNAIDPKAVSKAMRELYDSTSEISLIDGDKPAQQKTFVMTMAQAFPAAFGQAGVQLAADLGLDKQWATKLLEVSKRLADGNAAHVRPQPDPLVATVSENRIDFTGRPDSVKDSSTMGSHTCAVQLIKNAATHLLMPDGELPTRQQLNDSLEAIRDQFDLSKYSEIFFDKNGPVERNDADELRASQPWYTNQVRYCELEKHHEYLDELLKQFAGLDGDDVVDEATVAEAAELYMRLVDDRPTAVHYGAPANSAGEATTLDNLENIEARGNLERYGTDDKAREQLLRKALGLFDCHAAIEFSEVLDETFNTADDYLLLVAQEFLYFFGHAYPKICAALATTDKKIRDLIRDIGGDDKKNSGDKKQSRKKKQPSNK